MFRVFIFITAITLFSADFALANETKINELCNLVRNSEKDKNGADYVAGVDVHGNSVVYADINTNALKPIYNPITIPIEIDLAQRYGLNLPLGAELKPNVADIKIFTDGRVQYNGFDISENIQILCQNYHDKSKKNQSDQTEQHGHESGDPVLSSDKIEVQYPEYKDTRQRYND